MHGFLFIDKLKGETSFSCVSALRRILGVRKIGFLGTLDPLATGLLIFAVGEATKLISFLEGLDKTYEVSVRMGAVSNTYDAEGEIEEISGFDKPELSKIEKILKNDFLGEREQVPPAFSAIHIDGKRAYELARKGEKVEMKSRKVTFYGLKIVSYEWPLVRILVHCGSGTYVRSLAHDLGQKLGCGGYVEELRRTKVSNFSVEEAVELGDDVGEKMVPVEDMFPDWQRKELSDVDFGILANGGFVGDGLKMGENPGLAMYKGQCVGVLEVKEGKLKFKRKFNII